MGRDVPHQVLALERLARMMMLSRRRCGGPRFKGTAMDSEVYALIYTLNQLVVSALRSGDGQASGPPIISGLNHLRKQIATATAAN